MISYYSCTLPFVLYYNMATLGRGIIKLIKILIIILLCLLTFSIFIFSQDVNDTNEVSDEADYFNKVKSVMDKDSAPAEKEANKEDEEKKNIQIGYYSYIKIIIVLLLVIAIIYGISYFLRRTLKIKGEIGDETAAILVNQSIGAGKWIQVVFVAGKYLVLGVTSENINLISEIEDQKEIERFEMILNQKKTEEGGNFIDVITDFFKNKLRLNPEKQKFDYEEDSIEFLKEQKKKINDMNSKK